MNKGLIQSERAKIQQAESEQMEARHLKCQYCNENHTGSILIWDRANDTAMLQHKSGGLDGPWPVEPLFMEQKTLKHTFKPATAK